MQHNRLFLLIVFTLVVTYVTASDVNPKVELEPIAQLPISPLQLSSKVVSKKLGKFDLEINYGLLNSNTRGNLDRITTLDVYPVLSDSGFMNDKSTVLPVARNAMSPAFLGDQFYLPELSEDIMGYHKAKQMSAPIPPPPPGSFGTFMNTIAKGQYVSKAKRAKKIIEKAIDAGNFIDKLTEGDLVTMPIVMQKQVGQKQIDIVFMRLKSIRSMLRLKFLYG